MKILEQILITQLPSECDELERKYVALVKDADDIFDDYKIDKSIEIEMGEVCDETMKGDGENYKGCK